MLIAALACGGLLVSQLSYFTAQFFQYETNQVGDFAFRTLDAARLILAAKNPYTTPIDPYPYPYSGPLQFNGYKYFPLMAVMYMPLGVSWGVQGLLLTNLVLQLAVAFLIFLLGRRMGTTGSATFAVILYLTVQFAAFELFYRGATDLAPVLPLLIALMLYEEKPALTGCMIGLSISMKPVPGLLLALCCLPRSRRWKYVTGAYYGMIPTFVFLALSPLDLISNTLLFVFQRPVDSTSWLYGLPSTLSLLARIAFALTLLMIGVYVWFNNPSLIQRCGLAMILILGAILSGPVAHRNYMLWWLPLFALIVGRAAFTHESSTEVC